MNDQMRKALYRKIEVGRRQIPYLVDDDHFHTMLQDEYGVSSRKDMSISQLEQLLSHLGQLGAKFSHRTARRNVGTTEWVEITDSMPFSKEKRQILAIWHKLGYSMSSLNTRCKREFGVPVFEWIKDKDQVGILLSDLQRREISYDRKMRRGGDVR